MYSTVNEIFVMHGQGCGGYGSRCFERPDRVTVMGTEREGKREVWPRHTILLVCGGLSCGRKGRREI